MHYLLFGGLLSEAEALEGKALEGKAHAGRADEGSAMNKRAEAHALFLKLCAERHLNLSELYFDALFRTAEWLSFQKPGKRKTFGIAGAQGSGKSTFSDLLSELLSGCFDLGSVVLSLDDFYLTQQERDDLSGISHMLKTRGVPGTHSLELALAAVSDFQAGRPMCVPEFSKPHDDRLGFKEVETANKDLLIFEGWCWGAKPQPEKSLQEPINQVERELDAKGHWRGYVNEQLKIYQALFETDYSLFLKVPDFNAIKRWRWQQEQGLPEGPARMTEPEVERFIMFYQRITEALLASRSDEVDICFALNQDHDIEVVKFPAL
jgi:D-glycerate 3-kinase